jgi:hypothetical protein
VDRDSEGGGEVADFFWFSDVQRERFAPFLPTDVRDKARMHDSRVLSGIVHAPLRGPLG